jgi:hypothetical protein
MFFTGGIFFLAHCFKSWFPTHEGADGETLSEVPIVIVAFTAIAVSSPFFGD